MRCSPDERFPLWRLVGLTAAALAVHGYHMGVEDGEIYVPAARKLLHPDLYPFGTEFFLSHGHLSLFSPILAWTSKLTHMPMDWTLFVWYVVSLAAMLASCWLMVRVCFSSPRARWCSMLAITAVMTMPATNTALLLMDPYLTARSLRRKYSAHMAKQRGTVFRLVQRRNDQASFRLAPPSDSATG